MSRKPVFEGSGKGMVPASDDMEDYGENEDKRLAMQRRRAKAKELLSQWGW